MFKRGKYSKVVTASDYDRESAAHDRLQDAKKTGDPEKIRAAENRYRNEVRRNNR